MRFDFLVQGSALIYCIFWWSQLQLFRFLDQRIIDAICERLTTKTYIRGSTMFYPGGYVNKIVFIIQGKMESVFVDEFTSVLLSEGDFCGETLLPWCLENSSVYTGSNRRHKLFIFIFLEFQERSLLTSGFMG